MVRLDRKDVLRGLIGTSNRKSRKKLRDLSKKSHSNQFFQRKVLNTVQMSQYGQHLELLKD